jgi:hypothetical protein
MAVQPVELTEPAVSDEGSDTSWGCVFGVAGDSTFRSVTDRIRCVPSMAAVRELAGAAFELVGAALAIDVVDAGGTVA